MSYAQLIAYIDGLYSDGSLSEQDYVDIINYIVSNGDPETDPRDLIQIRRGNEDDLPTLAQGEMAFTLDTHKLFIGGLNGNVTIHIDYINVKHFGAKGDGVTDDTSKIQAAIALAETIGGGAVFFPSGNYVVDATLTIEADNVSLLGVGAASIITSKSTTNNVIDIYSSLGTINKIIIEKLSFNSSVTRTAGTCLNFLDVVKPIVKDCFINNHFNAIALSTCLESLVDSVNVKDTTNIGINLFFGDDFTISNSYLTNDSVSPGSVGIKLSLCGGVYISNVDVTKFAFGVYSSPAVDEYAIWVFMTNVALDSCEYGVWCDGSVGSVSSWHFSNCWCSSNTEKGLQLNSVKGFQFSNGRIIQNHKEGAFIDSDSVDVKFIDTVIADNSVDVSNTYNGLLFGVGASKWSVKGCSFINGYAGGTVNNQKYGIAIASGVSQYYSIIDNYFRGMLTGDISDEATPTETAIIDNNITDVSYQVASTTTLQLPPSGNYFLITGTTPIANIGFSWIGRRVVFSFDSVVTISTGFNFKLAGGTFTSTVDSIIEFIFDGVVWQEVGRSVNS